MNIREKSEEREIRELSPIAAKSLFSQGRAAFEPECEIRTCFSRDRDRIIHSKAFRRLMYKTQAFVYPDGDHFRTRLTHTLEVCQIAATISRALCLNEDLTEAIALGHDLGHTPFGHMGENDLNSVVPGGFRHNEQSVRIVTQLEKDGKGLNLTYEVIDGIKNHRGSGNPKTAEGKVVQLSDKIAYVNHDIDDAVRSGHLTEEDLPKEAVSVLGNRVTKRIDFLVKNVIKTSLEEGEVKMSEKAKKALYTLRAFMFENIYKKPEIVSENKSYETYLSRLYHYYEKNFNLLSTDYLHIYNENEKRERIICDYIAGMTDRFVINLCKDLFGNG
ncbi:MAG: deoxyguanosinetriphosphate triphosphohydrolase [Clostridiales bacterium]|nr:deoxyguanosinetriphosphate triphosphohydrolase [Clostridiales bacterium]